MKYGRDGTIINVRFIRIAGAGALLAGNRQCTLRRTSAQVVQEAIAYSNEDEDTKQ
jgi:hypothetical protein